MQHYYRAFSQNADEAKRKRECIEKEILPFSQYIKTAITTLEKKEVKARWERVETEFNASLEINGYFYEYKPLSQIRLKDEIYTRLDSMLFLENLPQHRDYDEKLFIALDNDEKVIIHLKAGDIAQGKWALYALCNLAGESGAGMQDSERLDSSDRGFICLDSLGLNDRDRQKLASNTIKKISWSGDDIQAKKLAVWLGSGEVDLDSKQVFIKDIKKLGDKARLYDKNGISYTLRKIEDKGCHIKLLKDDSEKEDEDEIESPLRFFLDSKVVAHLDGHKKPQECEVRVVDRDEFIIELRYKNRPILPRQDSILKTKPKPHTLKCQKNAIQNLREMPLSQSHTLLDLFASRKKDKINWLTQDSKTTNITEWEVLTDENRKGADIQRKFIQQALNTTDFALLDWISGQWQNYDYFRAIAQIIKQNKRVLLCGSTHIAIDNVLERLKEKNLIEKLNIFPIRVGREGALSEEVKEFRLGDFGRNYEGSLLEKYSVYDDIEKDSNDENNQGKIGLKFFMQCANLVCGTTIGILKYPGFEQNRKGNKKHQKFIKPIMPDFDYLIIDESSKTTFQEFLVPAMYAKKWIIVGDTRQLSPFVDRDELENNISNLALGYNKSNKSFDSLEPSYQQSCFLLYLLAKIYKDNGFNIKIAMGVSSRILEIIQKEITIRREKKRDTFGVLNSKLEVGYIEDLQTSSYFDNLSKHWIFYDENLVEKDLLHSPLKSLIPSDFIDFSNLSLLYQYQYRHKNTKLMFDSRDRDLESFLKAIKEYRQERSFASEIAWRLSREFELRTFSDSNKAKNKNQSYTKTIDELLPKSHKDRNLIRNKISSIANIALPSILESLIKGVSDRRSEREDSAIRSGFTKDELEKRHSILSTQGRMHTDISRFPREQFYKEANALQDLPELEREWSYTRYKKRSVWINVDGKSYRGRNEKEAEILIKELQAFIDFASKNPHPLNETWSIAVLSFYKGQTRILESKLQKYTGLKHKSTDFTKEWNGTKIQMKLCTVDKFQGQEADIVFLSMVNTDKIGFLDNPNRLNVGITRAKFQLVIVGKYDFFRKCRDDMLKQFALHHKDTLHKGSK